MRWDVAQYQRYADERGRPFLDLTARIEMLPATQPRIVDLGCGPGNLTALLAQRWPDAAVHGLDSSPDMVAAAQELIEPGRLSFSVGDLRAWAGEGGEPVDLIVSNATLQWVPDHEELFPALVARLALGGWLAFGVPGNFDAPSHRLLAGLRASSRWREHVGDDAVRTGAVLEPADYLSRLTALGCTVDAWETTYLHVLNGQDAVLEWVRGSALRPVLDQLDDAQQQSFVQEYAELLRGAYPRQGFGTVLPFRRIFIVARREGPTGNVTA